MLSVLAVLSVVLAVTKAQPVPAFQQFGVYTDLECLTPFVPPSGGVATWTQWNTITVNEAQTDSTNSGGPPCVAQPLLPVFANIGSGEYTCVENDAFRTVKVIEWFGTVPTGCQTNNPNKQALLAPVSGKGLDGCVEGEYKLGNAKPIPVYVRGLCGGIGAN
jgi:hypothetical protein